VWGVGYVLEEKPQNKDKWSGEWSIDTVANMKARVKTQKARREGSKGDIKTSESEKGASREVREGKRGWKNTNHTKTSQKNIGTSRGQEQYGVP